MGKPMTVHEFVQYVEGALDDELVDSFIDKLSESDDWEEMVASLFRTAFATAFVVDRLAAGPASGVRFESTDREH